MARDDGKLSATETLQRELSRADHLAVLGGIWDDLVRCAQRERFEQALRGALPPSLAGQALADPARTWLWRTLREAETAGLDGARVLRQSVGERSMAGARDPVRVLDARIRRRLAGAQPQPPGPFASRVPETGDPAVRRFPHELAGAMDDRVRRLGEHAAAAQPFWAIQGLGPMPADAAERAGWEHRAGRIAAHRERYGHEHPGRPDRPRPGPHQPLGARRLARGARRARPGGRHRPARRHPTGNCGCGAAPASGRPRGRPRTWPNRCASCAPPPGIASVGVCSDGQP